MVLFLENTNEVCSLFEYVAEIATECGSKYRNLVKCRNNLMEFMKSNNWFGIEYELKNDVPYIHRSDIECVYDNLFLWLSAYGKPSNERIMLLLNHFDKIYPITCNLLRKFIDTRIDEYGDALLCLTDYLFYEINKEIIYYRENDIEKLVEKMHTEATYIVSRLFAEFLQTSKYKNKSLTNWVYKIDNHKRFEELKGAYEIENFSVMAYCVFNEQMWVKQNLMSKALESSVYANLWLFTALHFICALRVSDIKRLPVPNLLYSPVELRKKLKKNEFSKADATHLSEELEFLLEIKTKRPSKTLSYSNVPNLKLFVPTSLMEPFGVIMAIVLSHRSKESYGKTLFEEGSNLAWDLTQIRKFFGDDFTSAIGNRRFSNLRANKAYLQGLETVADIRYGSDGIKGYMLAALARSHKGEIGSLAKTTEVYLRDAKFSGYNPQFIIREMFERGVFGFIPTILLEMYIGSEYKKIPITQQTELICKLELTPFQIEELSKITSRALDKSRHIVSIILSDIGNCKENIHMILQNIASGNSPGVNNDCLCLRTAAKLPCPYSDRNNCIGCGFEIYTKATMHTLVNEYIRLNSLKMVNSNKADTQRYKTILETVIIPAMTEMISVSKEFYDDEINVLLDEIERGITYVNGSL